MQQKALQLFGLTVLTSLLVACGGGSSNNATATTPNTPPTTDKPTVNDGDKFSLKGQKWQISGQNEQAQCYSFAQHNAIDCTNPNWDLKAVMQRGSPSLFTNGGTSGTGQGAVLYSPFEQTWADLSKLKDATQQNGDTISNLAWFADAYSNAFTQKAAHKTSGFMEYDLFADHKFSPNFQVYFLTTNKDNKNTVGTAEQPVYAVQIFNYYNPVGASGYISIRYIDTRFPNDVRTISNIDASKNWAYLDLKSGSISNSNNNSWQLAFNRLNVQTSANMGSAVAFQPNGFYDEKGNVILNKFKSATVLQDTEVDLKNAATTLSQVKSWSSNSSTSLLSPAYQGAFPNALNFGWYNYYPTEELAQTVGLHQHMLKANPNAASIVRGATGKNYARLHLTDIQYADKTNRDSATTWAFELDIQP